MSGVELGLKPSVAFVCGLVFGPGIELCKMAMLMKRIKTAEIIAVNAIYHLHLLIGPTISLTLGQYGGASRGIPLQL